MLGSPFNIVLAFSAPGIRPSDSGTSFAVDETALRYPELAATVAVF